MRFSYKVFLVWCVYMIFWALTGLSPAYQPVEPTDAYHLLDLHYLKTDLFQSLLYLHTQPPVYNALTGILLKIAGPHIMWVYVIWLSFTLIPFSMGVIKLGQEVSTRFWYLVPALILLFPMFWVQLNYTWYDWLCIVWMSFTAWAILSRRWKWTAIGFALLSLTRGQFVWFLMPILLWFLSKDKKAVILFLSLIGIWLIKNVIIFGMFSLGHWDGYTLTRGTPFNGYWWMDFNDGRYIHAANINKPVHPVCSDPFKKDKYRNWNHNYQRDAAKVLVPAATLWRMKNMGLWMDNSFYYGFSRAFPDPSSRYGHVKKSYPWFQWYTDQVCKGLNYPMIKIPVLKTTQDRLVHWLSADPWDNPVIPLGILFFIIGLFCFMFTSGKMPIVVFCLYIWIWLTGALTDGNELNRMLYPFTIFILTGWANLLIAFFPVYKSRWSVKTI